MGPITAKRNAGPMHMADGQRIRNLVRKGVRSLGLTNQIEYTIKDIWQDL